MHKRLENFSKLRFKDIASNDVYPLPLTLTEKLLIFVFILLNLLFNRLNLIILLLNQ